MCDQTQKTATTSLSGRDLDMAQRLRAGDADAYSKLVGSYHDSMVRVASRYVSNSALAEEVAQETWLAVFKGIDGFRGTGSLRSWIFMILKNKARQRGSKEARTAGFGSLDRSTTLRFGAGNRDDEGGHVELCDVTTPERILVARETLRVIDGALGTLTTSQRTTVLLRDVLGASSQEVCVGLKVSAINQRVLLHRGRASVRGAVEAYLEAS